MKHPAAFRSAAGLFGSLCACLLTFSGDGRAEPTGPGATNAETPAAADDSKPDETSAPSSDTEIFASQGATFAAKDRIAVFDGDVRVKDPRFNLACDKLTVYLSKSAMANATPTPTPTPTATPPPLHDKQSDAGREGGIDHALAEGHVIIVQKRAPTKAGEEEKTTIARADTAEFDNKTGNMTLRGMPKVEQNGNLLEALSRSTYFVLHRDNSLETHGATHTILLPHTSGNPPGNATPAGSPANRRAQASSTP